MTPEERYAASGIEVRLASSLVRSARYDAGDLVVDLEGRRYRYSAVPVEEFIGLLKADSPGHFYNLKIKGRYACERL